MVTDGAQIERVFSRIDQNELADLVMALCDFTSLTGHEQEIGAFILNWFEQNGFRTVRQEVENGRCNVIGIVPGCGGGQSLVINGHMDIGFSDFFKGKAYARDGRIYGREICNMRAGLASFMVAGKALMSAGVKLKGDLMLATVVGEISSAPVGPFQGPQDRGEGTGTRHLLCHGIQSDYAVVADGSDFSIIRAQAGVADFRISTKGEVLFAPFTRRTEDPAKSQNAIIKMTRVIEALENWAREYETGTIYQFPGGQVEPRVIISAIQAGMPGVTPEGWRLPFRPSRTPPCCEVYLDVRLAPGVSPVQVKHDLESVLAKLPVECEIEMFRSQRGYHGAGAKNVRLGAIVEKAHERVFGSRPPAPPHGFESMWTDTNVFWEQGIPALKWGPSRRGGTALDRSSIEAEALVRAARVYSLIALEICG